MQRVCSVSLHHVVALLVKRHIKHIAVQRIRKWHFSLACPLKGDCENDLISIWGKNYVIILFDFSSTSEVLENPVPDRHRVFIEFGPVWTWWHTNALKACWVFLHFLMYVCPQHVPFHRVCRRCLWLCAGVWLNRAHRQIYICLPLLRELVNIM